MENTGETSLGCGGGAPGGANWSEIRGLIVRCGDLPEDVRGQLVALGDKFVIAKVECEAR
jgi:hypothetical protein